jgi:hypothetical protein
MNIVPPEDNSMFVPFNIHIKLSELGDNIVDGGPTNSYTKVGS